MKVKDKATEAVATTKRIIDNAETFVQATALAILVGFSYSQLHKANLPVWGQWAVTTSLVIVGLTATWMYIKFFDKK